MSEPIALHAADPSWPAAFLRERDVILPCFEVQPRLIEHIGSTAIPALVLSLGGPARRVGWNP